MDRANLCFCWNRHLRAQTRCRSTRTAKRRYLRFRTRDHQQSRTMVSYTLLFPLALLILLPFTLSGARTRLLPSRLPALMMVFFPLLTSPPVFLHFFPSGAWFLFPCARVRLNRFLLRLLFVRHPRPLGRISFPFFPALSPVFSIFSSSISCTRVSSEAIPSPLPTFLASLHSLLLHLHQVAQCSVICPFLADITCHDVSLCRSLIFLPPPSFLFPSATGDST